MQKNEEILQQATIGGSMDTALSGQYSLSGLEVLKHAALLTTKNLFTFLPAVFLLFLAQIMIAWFSLKLQIGEPMQLMQALAGEIPFTDNLFDATQVANLTAEVLSVPLYAAVYLLAISNSVGLSANKNIGHILMKGFQYTLPLTITMMIMSVVQFIGSYIFFLLGFYVSLIFSFAIPLVCEKRLTPTKAMMCSVQAVNRKLFPIIQVYLVVFISFLLALMTMGIALFWVIPFFFHVKAVLYRNIFGVQVVVSQVIVPENKDDKNDKDDGNSNPPNQGDSSDTFDA